ncbi:MAG: hypothetical protein IPO35_12700, partial [Uliginosibacterium sp.]|nr:hypothetical protein [Uliginosibacterium sp.]
MALTPTVSVPAGSTSLLVRVPTVNDLVSEPTETVSLSAATAQNTTPVAGTGSILDNDGAPPCRSPARPRLMRRPARPPIRSRCPIRPPPRSPSPGTANGTATAGSDYTATSGSLTFAPGATVATFT